MNPYDVFMFPLEKLFLHSLRKKIIAHAKGKVLELGAGTGVNFKYYDMNKVTDITVLDQEINPIAHGRGKKNMEFIAADASAIPFPDNTFDSVVETLLLCSIEEPDKPLQEIQRVLKPDGLFVHIDHGLPKRKGMRKLFHKFAPAWYSFSKSCRIDKIVEPMIDGAGFETKETFSSGGGVFYGGISTK